MEERKTGTRRARKESIRPRAGLILLMFAGLLTLYVPIQLYWLTFVPGNFAFTGILFGGLLLSCGVIGWVMPRYVRLLGVFGIVLSILSLIGALGGLLIGMVLGIIGGSLCIAWDAKPEIGKKELSNDSGEEVVAAIS
ncbi:DUF6114 domain-containing protein [Marininema halotolerans]|uniref:Uncharacterized protein n=1 Tax=Marininema halotolerans TaxID=1155944 RepID=A0A1I6NR07_9BACL|nr:DUF6114 domain-containing protein [Marininema halotolerans]SFS30347.1 hypothetical protein SAMN05444972_10139 [Marininema halotolerans]